MSLSQGDGDSVTIQDCLNAKVTWSCSLQVLCELPKMVLCIKSPSHILLL